MPRLIKVQLGSPPITPRLLPVLKGDEVVVRTRRNALVGQVPGASDPRRQEGCLKTAVQQNIMLADERAVRPPADNVAAQHAARGDALGGERRCDVVDGRLFARRQQRHPCVAACG